MRKILIYILAFTLICFMIPIFFTNKNNMKECLEKVVNDSKEKQENNINYEYKEYGTVKLLHHESGQVEEIPIDEYLYGVVAAEMPASFEEEALKAQAIVARTYTIYKIQETIKKHENADICDDSTCCQAWISKDDRLLKWEEKSRDAYWNKITRAVDRTKRKNNNV